MLHGDEGILKFYPLSYSYNTDSKKVGTPCKMYTMIFKSFSPEHTELSPDFESFDDIMSCRWWDIQSSQFTKVEEHYCEICFTICRQSFMQISEPLPIFTCEKLYLSKVQLYRDELPAWMLKWANIFHGPVKCLSLYLWYVCILHSVPTFEKSYWKKLNLFGLCDLNKNISWFLCKCFCTSLRHVRSCRENHLSERGLSESRRDVSSKKMRWHRGMS